MATTRQSIIRGPGTVTFDGVKFFDASGITAEIDSATADIPSSMSGKLDTIKTDQIGKIALTPVGNLAADLLNILYPAWTRNPVLGETIFGATDQPLVIASRAGQKVTFNAAALTKLPELYLSTVKTAFGAAEWTALVANGKLPDEENAFYSTVAAVYADGEAPRTGLSGKLYTGSWGSLAIPDTVDGWVVTVEMQTNPVITDSQGTIDYTLTGINVTAKCTPLGLSEADILAALPTKLSRGSSLATANDLVISAPGGLAVTLKNAALVTGPLQWGSSQLRAGELGFVANINTTDGSLYNVALAEV